MRAFEGGRSGTLDSLLVVTIILSLATLAAVGALAGYALAPSPRLATVPAVAEPATGHDIFWVVDFPMFEWNEDEGRLDALEVDDAARSLASTRLGSPVGAAGLHRHRFRGGENIACLRRDDAFLAGHQCDLARALDRHDAVVDLAVVAASGRVFCTTSFTRASASRERSSSSSIQPRSRTTPR